METASRCSRRDDRTQTNGHAREARGHFENTAFMPKRLSVHALHEAADTIDRVTVMFEAAFSANTQRDNCRNSHIGG